MLACCRPRWGRAASVAALLALFALPSVAFGQLAVTFELADGATVSDTVSVVAKVTGAEEAGVDKVDFTVDGQAAGTDSSTPYSLEWDTLQVPEGEHTIGATATDANGKTASASVRLKVDNELSKGAAALAAVALEAMKSGDRARGEKYARRALKVDSGNVASCRALAEIYRLRKEYARAIGVLSGAAMPATEVSARLDLVRLHVMTADNAQNFEGTMVALKEAIRVYGEANAARLAAATTPIQRGDARFAAHDYNNAIVEYEKSGDLDSGPIEGQNRLVLAYMYAGRMKEAAQSLKVLHQLKRADDTSEALQGLLILMTQKPADARKYVEKGEAAGSLPSLLVAAAAEIAMNKRKEAEALVAKAAEIAPALPEVQCLRSDFLKDDLDARAAWIQALSADPSLPDAYVLKAFKLAQGQLVARWEQADALLLQATKLDPLAVAPMVATAVFDMARSRAESAEALLDKALTVIPTAPDVLVAKSLCASMLDKRGDIIRGYLDKARASDDTLWNLVFPPKPMDMLLSEYRFRKGLILTPASLYPAAP